MHDSWLNWEAPRRPTSKHTAALSSSTILSGAEILSETTPALAAGVDRRSFERPRTKIAKAVDDLLTATSPQFLIDHCRRSFALALLFAEAQNLDVDVEVLYAGVLLHDLGLTSRFHSTEFRFEVASANAARDLVRAHGMDAVRAGNVWDVAAMHATAGLCDAKSPETAVGSSGIASDVTGSGLDGFAPEVIQKIMVTRPGFARPFVNAIVADLQDKPSVAAGTWMSTIAADHIPGFEAASIEQIALNDPFESAHLRR